MDGVLTNWIEPALKLANVELTQEVKRRIKEGDSFDDIIVTWDNVSDNRDFTWWAALEKLPWADELVERASKLGNVSFLTSPGNIIKHTDTAAIAAYGKIKWCAKHFPNIPLVISYEKYPCACRNSILVDDSMHKIEAFKKHGGNAFWWPNQYSFFDKDLDVQEVIGALIYNVEICKKV